MIRFVRAVIILGLSIWIAVSPILLTANRMEARETVSANEKIGTIKETGKSLLQFASRGHILGFEASGLYIASVDHGLRIQFVGANTVQPVADTRSPHYQGAPVESQTQPLERVTWRGLWEGISLTYQAAPGSVAESVYRVEPGASPDHIRLRYNVPTAIDSDGSLKLNFAEGEVRESAPVAWQEIDGRRVPVSVAFHFYDRLSGNQAQSYEVGFGLGKYDTAYPLVIDPTITWNTFFGGAIAYTGNAIALDPSGNIFLTGEKNDTWESEAKTVRGPGDIFVTKLASSGNLLWNKTYGGSGGDTPNGIAVDAGGNLFLTGKSTASWGPSPKHTFSPGVTNVFVADINALNGSLVWNTFWAGDQNASGKGISLDAAGNVYITGESYASWGTPINPHTSGVNADAFVARMSATTGSLDWNTFLGSTSYDMGSGIVISGPWVFVVGESRAVWGLPVQGYQGGYSDAFLARLTILGTLQLNTFIGGTGTDSGKFIAVDGNGNIFTSGISSVSWGNPVRSFSGVFDTFVASFTSGGIEQWNTFLGGPLDDTADGLAVDAGGYVYVSGSSEASWGSPLNMGDKAYAAKLSTGNGAMQWNTFLGVPDGPTVASHNLTVDPGGNIYITGFSNGSWGTPKRTFEGENDAFVGKLSTNGALQWHTFIVEMDDDVIDDIVTDTNGTIFVLGTSNNGWGLPNRAYTGSFDSFVARMTPNGTLDWLTYLGGSGADRSSKIIIDGSGRLYVTGASDASWGSPVRTFSGVVDAFVARLDAATGNLIWNTFLGGSQADYGGGLISFSGSQQVVMVGSSKSSWGSPLRAYSSGKEAFAAGMDALNGTLKWNTFLGGAGDDTGHTVTADESGKLYVLGASNASWGTPLNPYNADSDIFLAQLSSSGAFQWNTFLGSSAYDVADSITWDEKGRLLLVGTSEDTWGAPINPFHGNDDGFIASLNANNGSVIWNTFIGNSDRDFMDDIVSSGNGFAYAIGQSNSSWGSPVWPHHGSEDVLLIKINTDTGALLWHGYIGGPDTDSDDGIAMLPDGSLVLGGISYADWSAPGASPTSGVSGMIDGFVARVNIEKPLFLPFVVR